MSFWKKPKPNKSDKKPTQPQSEIQISSPVLESTSLGTGSPRIPVPDPTTPPKPPLKHAKSPPSKPGRPALSDDPTPAAVFWKSPDFETTYARNVGVPMSRIGGSLLRLRPSKSSSELRSKPKEPKPALPRRRTWTRTGYHWRVEAGPLASEPDLPTVHSQVVVEDIFSSNTPLPETKAQMKQRKKSSRFEKDQLTYLEPLPPDAIDRVEDAKNVHARPSSSAGSEISRIIELYRADSPEATSSMPALSAPTVPTSKSASSKLTSPKPSSSKVAQPRPSSRRQLSYKGTPPRATSSQGSLVRPSSSRPSSSEGSLPKAKPSTGSPTRKSTSKAPSSVQSSSQTAASKSNAPNASAPSNTLVLRPQATPSKAKTPVSTAPSNTLVLRGAHNASALSKKPVAQPAADSQPSEPSEHRVLNAIYEEANRELRPPPPPGVTRTKLDYPLISHPPPAFILPPGMEYPKRGLTAIRMPLAWTPDEKMHPVDQNKLRKYLESDKDYVDIAYDDLELCERFPAGKGTFELLWNDADFHQAFKDPKKSRGVVINGNDSLYVGEPVSMITGVLAWLHRGIQRAAKKDHKDVYILSYIAGRHASMDASTVLVGSVCDMLRSLSVQLLRHFSLCKLDLRSEYFVNVDLDNAYSLLWCFMSLLTAVAKRRGVPTAATPTRIVILIDGPNFFEQGEDALQREYEEFFWELDELVIRCNEGHHEDCFDPLRREWERRGLKKEGEYSDEWRSFVTSMVRETWWLRNNLVLTYVFLHPTLSRLVPRKHGNCVVLKKTDECWIV
ncbi:hypothetical protein BDY17DRAFT_308602 [Neohortaea acidophila]|uniref:Uncharacterized protein n=1 Tax=Neohortaea acidophila TaxID=245834 RepID=A0A6A6PYS6_9PEZI|nr:uncharacterized protein BDY17DRAFT_308602 [Neohortaea acidophila]KAF2485155.1 hypothetical protein BDY17DRAFT_308602 [Neohortaea acidophila]